MTSTRTIAQIQARAAEARLTAEEAAELARRNNPEFLAAQAAAAEAEAADAERALGAAKADAGAAVEASTGALEDGYADCLAKASAYLDAVEQIQLKLRPADEAARATARRLGLEVPARPQPFSTRVARDRAVADIARRFATERLTW